MSGGSYLSTKSLLRFTSVAGLLRFVASDWLVPQFAIWAVFGFFHGITVARFDR